MKKNKQEDNLNKDGVAGPPVRPDKNAPVKPDKNPDPTKTIPGINEPEREDPARIDEPKKNDPTRIDDPPANS